MVKFDGNRATLGRQGAWSLVLLLGSVNAACSGYRPPRDIDVSLTAAPAPVEGTPLVEIWARSVGRGLAGQVVRSDTVLYLGAADRHVIAIDLRNGATRWRTRVNGPIAEGVVMDSTRVYTHTERPDGRVYAMDLERGTRLWERTLGPSAAPPALIHGVLVVTTRGGVVAGVNPKDGSVRWRRSVGVARAPAYPAGGDALLLVTIDTLFRLDATSGAVLTRRPLEGTILSGWTPHPGYLIAGTTDSSVIGIRPDDLTRAWAVRVDAPVFGRPVVRGDTAWVLTRIGTLYRIPLGDAPVAERVTTLRIPVRASPALIGEWLVIGAADGRLLGLDHDGQIGWQTHIGAPVELAPLDLPDGFLGIGGRGDLHRYRL